MTADEGPELKADEADESDGIVAERLSRDRPVPSATFRGALGRYIAAHDPRYGHRPERLWPVVNAYVAVAAVLIALGLLQATGTL